VPQDQLKDPGHLCHGRTVAEKLTKITLRHVPDHCQIFQMLPNIAANFQRHLAGNLQI